MSPHGARRRSTSRPTIRDVAAKAGVSTTTVSRAFSQPDIVREDTRSHVLGIARSLGYEPNRQAQNLALSRTGALALLLPDIANPFFAPLIKGAQARSEALDYSLLIANSEEDAVHEHALALGMARRADGLILASPRMPDDHIAEVAAAVRTITVSRPVPGVSSILTRSEIGLREAVEHLAALGHRAILHLAGPEEARPARERRAAIRAAAEPLGIAVDVVGPLAPFFDAGVKACDVILERRPTAVIAYNDQIALGLCHRLGTYGLDVPGDVSVIGVDDSWIAPMAHPALTTVHVPVDQAGARAVEGLLQTQRGQLVTESLPTHLVIRDSTARPRPTP